MYNKKVYKQKTGIHFTYTTKYKRKNDIANLDFRDVGLVSIDLEVEHSLIEDIVTTGQNILGFQYIPALQSAHKVSQTGISSSAIFTNKLIDYKLSVLENDL